MELWWLVYTHISYFMERRAPLILPVSFGVKLNTIYSGWELLLCDQIMDLSSVIRHSAVRNSKNLSTCFF